MSKLNPSGNLFSLILFTMLLAAASTAIGGGATPWDQTFTYQGQLKSNGAPHSGSVAMQFSLWNQASGGSQVGSSWSQTVNVQEGLFSTEVFIDGADWTGERYLQISVAESTLGTRQRITPTATSMLALDGAGGSSPWTITGNNIFYTTGNVGVGTSTPSNDLHVVGGVTASRTGTGVTALLAETPSGSGSGIGIHGRSSGTTGRGIFGQGLNATGANYGVYGSSISSSGTGLYGEATSTSGTTRGVHARSSSTSGYGVHAQALAGSGATRAVFGEVSSSDGFGAYFTGPLFSGNYFQRRVGIGREPGTMLDVDAQPGISPLRVAVEGTTRLSMSTGGGLSVGSGVVSPDTGIRVQGASILNGVVSVISLGTSGGSSLCRNGSNQIAQCSSSARYKDTIVDLESTSELLHALRPVSYRWIDSGEEDLGLVAEEVAALEPRLATWNEAGEVEGVKYDRLAAVLVAVVQEQSARLESRDQELAELRAELEELRGETASRLAQLEGLLLSGPELAQGAAQ